MLYLCVVAGESALILIRHGESLWNEKNLFTVCVDVPLTPKGVEEAIEAGKGYAISQSM
jgi:2,3-bisphosphoglycerate-dependent phosphoglycerate mutase